MAVDKARTVDWFETQLGVNHLGHFAPTAPLLPAMLTTPGARIASMRAWRRRYGRWQAYNQSKLANLLRILELQ